jgi:hypothetical protein
MTTAHRTPRCIRSSGFGRRERNRQGTRIKHTSEWKSLHVIERLLISAGKRGEKGTDNLPVRYPTRNRIRSGSTIQSSRWCSVGQGQDNPIYQSENCSFILPPRSKEDDPRVLCERVGPNVTAVQITLFSLRATRDHIVIGSRQAFIRHFIGFKARIAEENRTICRKVLVDLQFQTECSKGRPTVPDGRLAIHSRPSFRKTAFHSSPTARWGYITHF